jgi:hypothetical protein
MPAEYKDPDEMVRMDPAGFAALIAGAHPEWQVLMDWEMGEVGSRPEERRAAGERAAALLSRIPDPEVREPWVKEAMRRLELFEGSEFPKRVAEMAAEVTRARAAGGRSPARLSVPPPSPSVAAGASDAGLDDGDPGHPPPSWEEFLATYAVQRPALARVLVDEMGLDLGDLASPAVRRILEAARAAPIGADLPLHALGPGDRRLAARLTLRDVPELGADPDPVALERAMADCVRQVRRAARRDRVRREIHELLGVPGAQDPERDENVAARLRELLVEERKSSG